MWTRTETPTSRYRPVDRRVSLPSLARSSAPRLPHAWPVGSPLSAEHLLERRFVQLDIRHRYVAVLDLLVVVCHLADAVLTQRLRDLRAGLSRVQHRDDLFFRESLLHRPLHHQGGL